MEIPRDTTSTQPGNGHGSVPMSGATATMPRPKTRQGKARLLTLSDLDGRTAAAREALQLVASIETDLGGDLTAGEQQLATRAALLGAIVSDFETRWVAGEQIPLSDYFAACNVQRRILATLGLQRRPKQIESVDEYVARQRASQENSNAPAASE